MKYGLQLLLASALLFFGTGSRAQNPLAPANGFSVFVKNNLYLSNTNVSKAVACGGNFKLGGNIGSSSAGTYTVGNTTASLVVGGSLDFSGGQNTQITNGYAQIGNCTGATVWYADPNNPNSAVQINQGPNYYTCCPWIQFNNHSAAYFGGSGGPVSASNNPVCATPAVNFTTAFTQLEANATAMAANTNNVTMYWNGAPVTSPATTPGWSQWNQVDITLANGVNILNLTMADLNVLQKFNFTNSVDANRKLIINVDGAGTQSWSVQTLQGASVDPAYLLYNFYNTTTLAINGGQNIKGTLLAPKADINKTVYSDIGGQVVAKSFINVGNNIYGADFNSSVPGGGGGTAATVAGFSINNNTQCVSGNAFAFTNTSTGSGTLTYSWAFGDGTTSTAVNPTKTYATAGTYTVTLTTTGSGGTNSTSKTVTVNAGPATGFTINNATQNLSGNSFTFTSNSPTSGNTYSWKFRDNGATGSGATVTRSFSGVGVYEATQIVTAGGCKDSATQRITVNTGSGSPTAPAWGFNVFVQNNANLIAPHTEGGVAAGGNLIIGGNYASAQNSPGTFRVNGVPVGLLVGGRIDPSGSNVYQVLGNTIAKIGDSTGYDVWYKDNNNAYSPIRVTPNGNYGGAPRLEFAVSANSFTPELSPTENPVFQSNLIDFGAAFTQLKSYSTNIATNPNNVTLYTSSNLTTAYPSNVVPANSQVYISLANGVNVLNLTGANLNNFQSITFQGGAPSATKILLVNVDAPGTFNWNVTNSAGTGATDGQYVLYNFPGTTQLNIVGSSAVLGTVFAPFADIDKTVNQGNIDGQIIGQSYKHNGGEDHPQYFTSPLPNMNGAATVAGFSVNANAQCFSGNSFVFTNTSTGTAPLTYQWNFGDGTTSTTANPTKTYTTAGTYTVKLVVTGNGGAKDSTTKTVTVNPQPAAGFAVNTASQPLSGNSFNFTPANNAAGNSYSWDLGDGTTSTAASISGKSYAAAGTYTVKLVITSAHGCKDSTTQTVTVTPNPASASFTINQPAQCLTGNSFVFSSTATGAAPLSYQWSFGDGTTATAANPTKVYSVAGTYSVKLIVTDNNNSKDSATQSVTVYPAATAGFTVNNSAQPLAGNSFDFTTTAPVSGNTYFWDLGDGTTATTADVTGKSYSAQGTYTIKQIVTTANGCKDSATQTVTVQPTPTQASFTINDPAQCVTGNLFLFTNTTTGSGPIALHWDFGDGAFVDNVSQAYHTYAAAGVYTVTLTGTGPGGTNSVSMQVTVYPAANAGFTTTPDTAQAVTGNAFTFTTNSQQPSYQYSWDFGDGTTDITAVATHSYAAAGPFTVRHIVTNGNGCKDTAYQQILVLSDSTGSGNNGGLESEGLGGLVTRRNYNRLKYDLNKTFNTKEAPVFEALDMAVAAKGTAVVQELPDMMPANLRSGDVPRISTPADLPALTIAQEALSVDYTRSNVTKASVLGIKTINRAYNHTKSICDRFKGGTILNIVPTTINGVPFSRYAIRQANGLVEYAIAFAAGKKPGNNAYRLQTGWVISRYAKDDTVYNFQVWAASPADANKLAGDILDKLSAVRPLTVVPSADNMPAAYITRGVRHKGTLLLTLRNTTGIQDGKVEFTERTNEVAGQQARTLPVTYKANGDAVVAVPIGDGYEYEGLLYLGDSLVDQVYLADGNWGLDFDKEYTSIQTYEPANNPARVYADDELPVYRSVTLKASSSDYITLYKSLLPGTEPLDLTAYKTLKFRAAGSGKMEIRLTRDSITAWKAQYKTIVTLVEDGKDYEISFEDFVSGKIGQPLNPKDVKTLDFTLSASGKTQYLKLAVENVSFSKKAVNSLLALKSKALAVSPNPAKGPFNVTFASEAARTLQLSVSDIAGRVLHTQTVQAAVGTNTVVVDLKGDLPTGTVVMVSLRSDDAKYESVKVTTH